MSRTLLDIKVEAENRMSAGRTTDSFKVYRLLLEAVPLDFNLRLEIADAVATRSPGDANNIYRAIAEHDIKSGHPLRAMVAIKLMGDKGLEVGPLLELLVGKYAAGSPVLGRGIKPAPTDWNAAVRDDLDLDYPMSDDEVFQTLVQMAAFTGNIENYPEVVPPLPIFSTLQPVGFGKLIELVELRRFVDGDGVIRQGDVGDAIYFVARGEVRVTKSVARPGGEDTDIPLARLGPGSLFGEMALMSSDPRGASVVCEESVDVLELKKDLVEQLATDIPNVAGAMARFTRERLIANLLATNPLFESFDDGSKKQLLARFTGHEVPSGTIFIEQGKPGMGLYLILQGNAEVLKWDNNAYVPIANLGAGDIVGEISLVHEGDATATVRTTSATTLLFLARELFYPLIEAIPDLLAHFARLAQERLDDTEFQLMQNKVLDDDFIESLEVTEELDDDELVCI